MASTIRSLASYSKEAEEWYQSLAPTEVGTSSEQLKEHLSLSFNLASAYSSGYTWCIMPPLSAYTEPNVAQIKHETLTPEELDFLRASEEKCTKYAESLTEIAGILIETRCDRTSPLTVYPIFSTAIIHIHDCFRENGEFSKTAQKYLLQITYSYVECNHTGRWQESFLGR